MWLFSLYEFKQENHRCLSICGSLHGMNKSIKQTLLDYNFKDPDLGDKWINRYIRFIEGCLEKQFDDTELFEYHHIVPRSWDPTLADDPNNIIKLPLSYHIVAHQLLALTRDRKMTAAFHILTEKSVSNIKHFNLKQVSFIVDQPKRLIYRPVVNLNTGETYCSLEEANRIADTYGLSNAIKNKTKVRGCYWQYKDVVDQTSIDHQLQLCLEHRKRTRQQTIGSFARPVINLNTEEIVKSARCLDERLSRPYGYTNKMIQQQHKIIGQYWALLKEVEQHGRDDVLYQRQQKWQQSIKNRAEGIRRKRCQNIKQDVK